MVTMVVQVFISISLILGDGLYNFVKILSCTARSIHSRHRAKGHKIGKKGANRSIELTENYDHGP